MAVTNGYCAVEDVRGQLTDSSSKIDAAPLERAINATSRAIDRYCGRRFWKDAAPVVRVFEADDAHMLTVNDIASATGLLVKVDSAGDGAFATTWTNLTDYQLRPLNADADGGAYSWSEIKTIGGLCFPWFRDGRPGVQVTAQWGWSQVPDQVTSAAILKTVSLFMRKDAPFGVAGFTDFGPVRITKRDPDVMDLLSPFVVGVVA
jgi:hypothetical protein